MKILGVAWAGVQTPKFNQMTTFCKEVLGLKPLETIPGIEAYGLPNGDIFEIVGPGVIDLPEFKCPKADFLVEDLAATRAEMEAKGVEFVGPIESDLEVGVAWTHFRAPDGHLYGLTTIVGHPDLKK